MFNWEKSLETFARFGYVAKGLIYASIGILALMAAFNIEGGETTGATGALQTISEQSFGKILLVFIAVNLVGYTFWQFIQAFKDPRNKRSGFSGLLNRLCCIFAGVAYAVIAVNAGLLAIGYKDTSSDKSESAWTAVIMAQPIGRWLIGIVGAIVMGVGFWEIYQAYRGKFRRDLNLKKLNCEQEKWLINISRYGIAARGLVFAAFGFFILEAAHQYNPDKARGFDDVLLTFAQQPLGKIFLALVAAGLIAYAVYLFILAFYRRIKTT